MSTRNSFPPVPTIAFGFRLGSSFEIDGEQCRISGENPGGSVTFVSLRTGRHFQLTRDEFMTKFMDEKIVVNVAPTKVGVHKDTFMTALLRRTVSGVTYAEHANYRADFVKAFGSIEPDGTISAFTKEKALEIHQTHFEKTGYPKWLQGRNAPSRATVYRWIKQAWKSANKSLLVPQFHLRGTSGPRCDPLIEIWMAELCAEHYFDADEANYAGAIALIETDLHEKISRDARLSTGPRPSISTIKRRLEAMGGLRRLEHEEGKRIARFNYKQSMAGPDSLGPMARWEIDHTKIDLDILDDEGCVTVGRVWLTVIIDHKTRMIPGYLLDVAAPDASAVLATLRFAMLPKTRAFLNSLGVKSDWPIFGVPIELVTDRGKDFLSHAVQEALRNLDIDFVILPPRAPNMKSRVERIFGSFCSFLFHRIAGTTKSNVAAKADRKPEENARMTFAELDSLIARTICDLYHKKPHSTLRCSPLQAWDDLGVKFPPPVKLSAREIREATMLSQKSVATRSGIRVEGILYGSVAVERIRSHAHAYHRRNPVVEALLDPNDIGKIFVLDSASGQLVEIPAVDPSKREGVSLRMHRLIEARLKSKKAPGTDQEYRRARAEIMRDIGKINRRRPRKLNPEAPSNEPGRHRVAMPTAGASTPIPSVKRRAGKVRKASGTSASSAQAPLYTFKKTSLQPK